MKQTKLYLVKVLLQGSKPPEHKGMTEWLGYDFDPEYFDIDRINELLKLRNYGCCW